MKWAFFLGVASLASVAIGQQDVVQDAHLYTKPSSNILVKFSQSMDGIYSRINRRTYRDRGDKIAAITSSLEENTGRWHKAALEGLKRFGIEGETLWITNEIYVKDASPLVVAYLSGLAGVKSIREEEVFNYNDIAEPFAPPVEPWGIPRIGAPGVWNHNTAPTTGQGIRVGVIDTGVRATHEILKDNWLGLEEYGWFDGALGTTTPNDPDGHGTHCTGIAVGGSGIGVAPGASWMHCKGQGTKGLTTSGLTKCCEFMLCPTDVYGNNKNCSRAPHIVSNSWGAGSNNTWYNDIIEAWNNAGIIPIFALGNEGPKCDSHLSPADQPNVISVGNSNSTEHLRHTSSRGPSTGPNGDETLPMISAPGTMIVSAAVSSDTDYVYMTGTSQACPHVAGSAALLLSRNPNLTREQIEDLLTENTFRRMMHSGEAQCGSVPEGVYPNNMQGWGRLDILASYNALLQQS